MLADHLCAAAASLLDIQSASLAALYDPTMSVPVGASDPAAAAAEQVQFTTGEGPCLFAQHTRALSVIADVGDLGDPGRRRWPTYAVLLMRATPFRSVIAVPVPPPAARPDATGEFDGAGMPPRSWGVPLVLTCYRQQPLIAPKTSAGQTAGALSQAVRAASTLSAAMGLVLSEAGAGATTAGSALGSVAASAPASAAQSARGFAPGWLDSSTALVRATVWQAEEVLMLVRDGLDRQGALAALRTYAMVYALSVDKTASRLLQGRLHPGQVLGDG